MCLVTELVLIITPGSFIAHPGWRVFFSNWFLGGTWTETGAGTAARTGTGSEPGTATGTGTGPGISSGEGTTDNLVVVEEKVVLVIA